MAFEIGPIRPPSEARSLLVRVTRNCPWNRCSFCPVYKGSKFSIRKVEEVQQDIIQMGQVAEMLRQKSQNMGLNGRVNLTVLRATSTPVDLPPGALQIAYFLIGGGDRAFLQDANSLTMPADQLVQVLKTLKQTFPSLTRITSYARAHTLTRRTPEQLKKLCQAGLNRIHVGLESGSDQVLTLMKKGALAARQIEAGLRAKAAGMELSEYLMPGLGGRALSREHALESARVLSAIDPHFIRLRTTAVAPGTVLEELVSSKKLEPMDDEEVVAEIRLFIENLEATSILTSDHILNLLSELEGQFPEDKSRLLEIIDHFQKLPSRQRRAFIIGRRSGLLTQLNDMEQPQIQDQALKLLEEIETHYGEDLQLSVRALMTRFV